MSLLPTFTEAMNTVHWIGVLLAFSTVLALFCVALALLLDWYEDRRQAKQAEKDADAQALRQRLLDEAQSYRRLVMDAYKAKLRTKEVAEEKYYQHALKTSGEPGRWPPPRRVQ